ncbi:MAG TPA: histidine kinase N-terminal 7TM domain-containing protein [Candidatus Wallbacteria bacterium]|nr:histidine kinase N-terminal 7TM domain-containing protein [Candidatus Wallbacteria bacterium]
MQLSVVLAIPPSIACLFTICLGLFILSQGDRSYLYRFFFFLCTGLSIYNAGVAMLYLSADASAAMRWASFSLYGLVLVLCLLPHFAALFLSLYEKAHVKYAILFFYASAGVFAAVNYYSLLITGVHQTSIGYVAEVGRDFYIFCTALVISIFYSSYLFFKVYMEASDEDVRVKIRHIFLGILVCSVFAIADMLKKINGIYVNFSTLEYGIIFFAVMTSYAVVKHHSFELEVAMSRGILYSLMMIFVALLFIMISVFLEQITQNWLGSNSFLVNIINAFLIAVLFEPIKNFAQRLLNRYLFPKIMKIAGIDDEIIINNQVIIDYIARNKIGELKDLKDKIERIIKNYEEPR